MVVLHILLLSQCHPHCRHMSSCLQKMFWHKPNLCHHQFPSCHALEHLGQPRTSKSWPEIIFEIILQIIQWQISSLKGRHSSSVIFQLVSTYLSSISCCFFKRNPNLTRKFRCFYERLLLETQCFIVNCCYGHQRLGLIS